jgi:AraC-like DNA-binding protein
MIFEFTSKPNFNVLAEFSAQFQIPVFDNCLTIPPYMGKGYIKRIEFGTDFRLIIHRYNLKEDLIIKRNASVERNDLISIFFYTNEQLIDLVYNEAKPVKFSRNNESAIQLTTSDMNSVIKFPANCEIYKCVVGITAILKKITSGKDPFTYFESMNQEMLRNLKQLSEINAKNNLSNFYYQIKVQELLYHLFDTLLKRVNLSHQLINNDDVEKLLVLRNIILEDLSNPPVLATLSKLIGMSETKMKHLFKQTFGDTIYNYYQKIRMEEAAFLLKQAGYSVSDVGHKLGFSNLSHFSRLFEKQFGVTPKKYSVVG